MNKSFYVFFFLIFLPKCGDGDTLFLIRIFHLQFLQKKNFILFAIKLLFDN